MLARRYLCVGLPRLAEVDDGNRCAESRIDLSPRDPPQLLAPPTNVRADFPTLLT